jgi:hypothetical protein
VDELVIGADGHLLSRSEIDEVRRLDEPASTEGAPDTRRVDVLRIEIERVSESIRKHEQHINEAQRHDWEWRDATIKEHQSRISELKLELVTKQAQLAALEKVRLPSKRFDMRPVRFKRTPKRRPEK